MFNAVSKTSFTVAGVAFVAAIAAIAANPDRVGFTVLVWFAAVASAVGVAIFQYTPRDPVVPVSPEVEAATSRTIDVTDLPVASPWPLVAAVAIALLGVGAALGASLIAMGLILVAIASIAWLGQVWREHPSWTEAMTDRLNDRFVVPIGLPATIVVFAGVGVISLSRVFLTVSKGAAPAIAAVVAFFLLFAFWLLSTRPSLGRSALAALVVGSSTLVVGAGVASALRGEREFHHKGGAGGEHGGTESAHIEADDLAFDKEHLQLPASSQIAFELENKDVAPHNWSLYDEEGGDRLFEGEVVEAGEKGTYELTTPEAGSYYFQCDLHPTMKGTAEIALDASEASKDGHNATTTSTTEP